MNKKKTPSTDTFYKKNKWYAVSINPDDKLQHYGKAERLKVFRSYYFDRFLSLPDSRINYMFYVELSEPRGGIQSQGPRLHLHGRIMFKTNYSIYKFLIDIMPEWLCHARLDIDTISDLEIWDTYCSKQQYIFKSINPKLTNIISPKCPSNEGKEIINVNICCKKQDPLATPNECEGAVKDVSGGRDLDLESGVPRAHLSPSLDKVV